MCAVFHSHWRTGALAQWRSGQVEGSINRREYFERQMHGREQLDLLCLSTDSVRRSARDTNFSRNQNVEAVQQAV